MKHEWRKHEKEIYLPKKDVPVIIDVPSMKYIVIKGEGSPASKFFSECIEALYMLSYGVKMGLKKDENVTDYFEYTVYPLEGVWDLNEEGRELYKDKKTVIDIKEFFKFELMIRQPDFLTKDLFLKVVESVYKKKKNELVKEAIFVENIEGLCAQILHIGSYDNEPKSFDKLEEFIISNGYKRSFKTHREIYLSDARKVTPDKLKTTLRVKIK